MADINKRYLWRQMLKSLLIMAVTFVPLFHWTFDIKMEIFLNEPARTVWERIFNVLSNTPYLPMHYWACFCVMLFLTMGNYRDYNTLIRYQSKRKWNDRQIVGIFGHSLIFSLAYSVWLLLVNFIYFGIPDTMQLPAQNASGVPANYSILFILVSTTVLRILSGVALALLVLYFYEKGAKRLQTILFAGLYAMLSVFVLYYGKFLKIELYKYLVFPGNASHYFFVTGSVWNNYFAAYIVPLALVVLMLVLFHKRAGKTELL